jgi:hypothetical protein
MRIVQTYGHRQEMHAMSPLAVNQFQKRISLPICLPIWFLNLSLPTYLSCKSIHTLQKVINFDWSGQINKYCMFWTFGNLRPNC